MALRLGLFYAAYFGMNGALLPFWPVWLAGRGLDAWTIAAAIGLSMATRVTLAPFVARAADRSGRRRRAMIVCALFTVLTQAAFVPAEGATAILVLSALSGAGFAAILPLGDALAMRHVGAGHIDYGPVRLWGSIAFVAMSLVTGLAVATLGSEVVLALVIISFVLVLASCIALPSDGPTDGARSAGRGWRTVLERDVLIVLPAAGLIQASHALYYGFGSLNWQREGNGETVIGALWAWGVVAEVVLFAFSARLFRHVTPLRLLQIAALLATVRWVLMAVASALPLLVLGQTLHAFSFGATHIAVLHWLHARMPPELAGTSQALYNAFGNGLLLTLATVASGPLYAQFGGYGYGAMAMLAAIGGLLILAVSSRGWGIPPERSQPEPG